MHKFRGFFLIVNIMITLLCLSNAQAATYNKNLWPQWQVNNPLSTATIAHTDWQTFLDSRIVTNEEGINLIDYASIDSADILLLNHYLETMAKVNIQQFNRQEQLAFWINLYNAATVHTVASYYPVSSIEEINISPGLFSIGPWSAKLVTVNNATLSLDEIQNRIIRPIWNDARTHYAINNGSIGAANLNKQAYQGKQIETQLDDAAFEYINSLRGAQVIEGKLIVSKIYEWFNDDFGGTKQDIINHLKLFARDPLKSQLKHINTIDNYVYNWHLNSTVAKNS